MKMFKGMTKKQRAAWAIVVAAALAASVMSGLAARNYTGIVETRILTAAWLETELLPTFDGADMTSLRLVINVTIDNPGDRGMTLTTVGYRAWLRDLPGEDGSDRSRYDVDGIVQPDEDTEYLYYPVFTLSWNLGTQGITVPGNDNTTVNLMDNVYDRSESPETFDNMGKLYAAAGGEPEWQEYCMVVMFVEGVPHSYTGSGSAYLSEVPWTHRYFGTLIYSGAAGLVNSG